MRSATSSAEERSREISERSPRSMGSAPADDPTGTAPLPWSSVSTVTLSTHPVGSIWYETSALPMPCEDRTGAIAASRGARWIPCNFSANTCTISLSPSRERADDQLPGTSETKKNGPLKGARTWSTRSSGDYLHAGRAARNQGHTNPSRQGSARGKPRFFEENARLARVTSELALHGEEPDARCVHCGRLAVGPCARCDAPVCGDCCVLTDGGARIYAIC